MYTITNFVTVTKFLCEHSASCIFVTMAHVGSVTIVVPNSYDHCFHDPWFFDTIYHGGGGGGAVDCAPRNMF